MNAIGVLHNCIITTLEYIKQGKLDLINYSPKPNNDTTRTITYLEISHPSLFWGCYRFTSD